ncbi:cytochrome P450 6k1-like isoform X1 [Agrilus planipennis]|uniref:Cytochrome P450 6k1-like isoform X1 n=1 Tax=Agrilus planipennis TaxID=224129 RepID=A0A1W4WRK9_AGRPL|nr:cytochrome P450 6k1-like isoform X1 [Agrilus planipennis]
MNSYINLSSVLPLVAVLVLTFSLYKYLVENFDYWEKRQIKFLKPVPFFGNFSKAFLQQKGIGFLLAEFYNQVQERFFGIFVLSEPVLVIRDPELIKQVLIKDFQHFADRSNLEDESIDNISADFLFFSKYKKWKILRSKQSPIFSSGKLRCMFLKMETVVKDMEFYINSKMSTNLCNLDVKELCNRYSTDVLALCIFGMKGASFENGHSKFYDIEKRIFGFSLLNDFRLFGHTTAKSFIKLTRLKLLDSTVMKFLRQTIGSQIEKREQNHLENNDFLDILVELKRMGNVRGLMFDQDRVVALSGQFIVAGYETVSTTLCFALYELSLNQEAQQKLRDELRDAVTEENGLDYETIHKLPYLDQVVKETLRKYPVLPYLDRCCTKEYRIPGSDLVLQPGSIIYIPMFGLHYDKNYFPDPNKFIPERFSEENKSSFPASAYVPFGIGPRVCIGERFALNATKLAIAQLLLDYHLEKCNETPIHVEFKARGITLMPTKKLIINFTKISQAAY